MSDCTFCNPKDRAPVAVKAACHQCGAALMACEKHGKSRRFRLCCSQECWDAVDVKDSLREDFWGMGRAKKTSLR